jgi:glycosyltransferase involved in cell wall biosynthesis
MPTVTVVVPVRNEARSIEATLRSLLTQDYPNDQFEVIVADGFSTDATVPTVRRLQAEFPNLQLLYNPSRYSSAARNTCVRHMTGEFAVVVDGHCHIPDRHYLRTLVEAFETTGADTLGRPQPLDAPNPTPFQRAVSVARASKLGHNPDSDIYSDEPKFVPPQNTAIAYRRRVFSAVGLFDQGFDACEDVEFNQRVHDAKLTCYFEPKLKVVYHPRANWKALFVQLGRYGCGRARLAAKHLRSITLPALVPPLWVLWLVAGPLLCLAYPPLLWVYGGLLLLYAAVVLAVSAKLAVRQPAAVGVRIPLVFVGIHFGFAYGFWRELGRRAAVRWGGRR